MISSNNSLRPSITRHTVAALAGVSHMTVSRVLNTPEKVSAELRKKVLQACNQLGYRRNQTAAALRSRESGTIGVLVSTLKHNFFGALVSELEILARDADYHVVVTQADQELEQATVNWDAFDFLLKRQVAGVIIATSISAELELRWLQENCPTVFVDTQPRSSSCDFVRSDDHDAMTQVIDFLYAQGHRRIAFAGGFPASGAQRYAAWQKALQRKNIYPALEDAVLSGFSFRSGEVATELLLASSKQYTAIVCANDYVAVGVMSCLARHKIAVPEQISVTGMANEPIAQFISPCLTTVTQPVATLASLAWRSLNERMIDHTRPPLQESVKGTLICRESTAPFQLAP